MRGVRAGIDEGSDMGRGVLLGVSLVLVAWALGLAIAGPGVLAEPTMLALASLSAAAGLAAWAVAALPRDDGRGARHAEALVAAVTAPADAERRAEELRAIVGRAGDPVGAASIALLDAGVSGEEIRSRVLVVMDAALSRSARERRVSVVAGRALLGAGLVLGAAGSVRVAGGDAASAWMLVAMLGSVGVFGASEWRAARTAARDASVSLWRLIVLEAAVCVAERLDHASVRARIGSMLPGGTTESVASAAA